ncbi:hypothetical protein L6452_40546 [Arctium lappa]|uniref:Uncharacterized protein n=1 Tax=Arctium lappa TaxID=4217 RepID=A0ACB8XM60_ARCLA|nr:hypothetical protein L6452_40546 [Arctium lappa]
MWMQQVLTLVFNLGDTYLTMGCLSVQDLIFLPTLYVLLHMRMSHCMYCQRYVLQAHVVSAVLNLSENCTTKLLKPYLDGIVGKQLILLQNAKKMVQEGALASVADSYKYYDAVMPYLKTIPVNAPDIANRMLRAKSMKCISLVGMADGKDKFKDNAKQVTDFLMSPQGSQLETDDPIISYMLQVDMLDGMTVEKVKDELALDENDIELASRSCALINHVSFIHSGL